MAEAFASSCWGLASWGSLVITVVAEVESHAWSHSTAPVTLASKPVVTIASYSYCQLVLCAKSCSVTVIQINFNFNCYCYISLNLNLDRSSFSWIVMTNLASFAHKLGYLVNAHVITLAILGHHERKYTYLQIYSFDL